ncbi:MAG: RpiB/LacA/LacB family sugar-phosphate isomerase [Candidatus Yanofskybacteria bacterium]|nr:RpiB/LacA/LacB family sugar-phosphate isomerase [Candidatus Yanofskybacteria bacterium]
MIYLGADHRGFELKEKAKQWLSELGYQYEDCGAFVYDKDDDYPDFARAVAEKVHQGSTLMDRGILICGSGIGVCIAANKIKGIRAGTAASPEQVKASVNDEDLNILCLSADYLPNADLPASRLGSRPWQAGVAAKEIIKTFLETKFSGEERHKRRIDKIEQLEQ